MRYTTIYLKLVRATLLFCVVAGLHPTAFAEMISGKVLSPEGKPVAGAIVVGQYPPDFSAGLLWPQETPPVKTGADGAFRLEVDTTVVGRPVGPNQPALKTRLIAGAAGFAPASVVIRSGAVLEIRLRSACTLQGVVNDAENKPLAGVRVRVAAMGTETGNMETMVFIPNALMERYSVTSDAEGKYTVPDVATTGTAYVLLTDDRYGLTFGLATLKTGRSEANPIVARPGGTLVGRVLLPDGKPAVGVRMRSNGTMGSSSPFLDFKTDAKGAYKISSLSAGSYVVRAETSGTYPTLKATPPPNQQVAEGKETAVPDLTLITAATLMGQVTEEETNKPLAGVQIMAGSDVAFTDVNGKYTLPAAPGSQEIRVLSAPEGYIALARATATLTSGATHTQNFSLKRGVTVTGMLRTTEAAPVPNVSVALRGPNTYASVTTDADGKFTLSGVEPGNATFTLQTDLWEFTGATQIELPYPQPVLLTVKKVDVVPISGRVVTAAGKPLGGTPIQVVLKAKEGTPGQSFTLSTDSGGQFTIRSRSPFETATVAPGESGYRVLRGGVLKKGPDGALQFEDLVVSAPTGKRTGQVVDDKGKPLVEALVIAAEGGRNSITIADTQGHFTLSDLPEGETQVFAGQRAGFTNATISTVDKTMPTLTLERAPAPSSPNPAAAIARWDSLWQEGKTNNTFPRFIAVEFMGAVDPDRALKLETNPNNPTYENVETIFNYLADVAPARAIAWIQSHRAKIRDENTLYSLEFRLTKALYQVGNTAEATSHYTALKAEFNEKGPRGGKEDGGSIALLAGLAAYARDPDAESLAKLALDTLQTTMEKRGDSKEYIGEIARSIVFSAIGAANPRLIEKLSQDLPKDKRAASLLTAILRSYRTNLTAAQTLLPLLRQTDDQGGWRYSQAARPVGMLLGTRNKAEALALAQTIPNLSDKALVLAACAAQTSVPTERNTLFREAFDQVANSPTGYSELGTAAQIAAMVYSLDPALGVKLFAEVRKKLLTQRGNDSDVIVRFAFYYARVSRGESRALLEAEWVHRKENTIPGFRSQSTVALAMAAVDIDRATEMADSLPTTNNQEYERFLTRCKIAQYLAFPSTVRRTLSFERWSRLDMWQPGMPEE